jgi:PAS domain S-box-containing protein
MRLFHIDENPLPGNNLQELRHFRAILENAQQFIGLLSKDGNILQINVSALKARDLKRNKVLGKYLWDTVWWQDWPDAQQLLQEAVHQASQGKTAFFTTKISGNEREVVTINFTLRPILNSDGEIHYLLPEIDDISDLSESIEQLHEMQRLLEQASCIACLGYWSWDILTDHVKLSKELTRIFNKNWDLDEENYQELLHFVHPEDRIVVQKKINTILHNDNNFSFQFRIIHTDGAISTLQNLGQIIRDDSNRPTRVIGIVQDITEIRSLETRLFESEKRFRYLVQELPNTGVVLFDPDLIVSLAECGNSIKNPNGDKLLGLPVSDVLGQIIGDRLEELELIPSLRDVFKGKPHRYEKLADKESFTLSLVPLRDDKHMIYSGMAVIQDITHQIQTAQRLSTLADQLKLLNQMGQVVVSTIEPLRIFREVLEKVREMVGAQGVFILLEKNGHLIIEAQDEKNYLDLTGLEVSSTESIAGEVWRTQRGMILSGKECSKRVFKPFVKSLGYTPHSFLAVPITWQDQKFGVIDAIHIDEGKFSQEDLKLIESAAAWTAIALNNSFQHKQMERRVVESEITLKLLEEILSASLTLDSVLQHVVDAGNTIVPSVDWAAIHLFNEQDNRLHLEAAAGINVPSEEYTMDFGQGIAGRVLESGRLINVADVNQDARVVSFPRASHAHSLLVAPIKNRDSVGIGTITLQSSSPGQFTSDDENLLLLLAHQAGLAIENARLYENVIKRQKVLQIQREHLRLLTHQIVTAQEDERERIARELHDETGQSLTALKISLEMLSNSLPSEMREVRQTIKDAAEQAGLTMENIRSLAHNLRPPALDRLGLNLALEGLCRQFGSMTHIQVIYNGIEVPRLPRSYEINLYRFVQEALTNIGKHANASEVRVWMDTQTGQIEIHVQDNGKGIQINPLDIEYGLQEGMGLASMEERLNIIDGKLEVRSVPGKGTHLRASVTLRLRDDLS